MKYMTAIFLLLICSVGGIAQTSAPQFATAVEYNDYIVDQQSQVGLAITDFMNEVNDSLSTKESCTQKRLIALAKVKDCRDRVKSLSAWKNDKSLRDTALILFNFYVRTFEVSYATLLDLVFTEPFTEDTELELDKVLAEIKADEAIYDEWFLSCQERFAAKHGFSLTE
jgi:hypothetical protein